MKIRNLLLQWRQLLCQNPPKGFEKFFKPGTASKSPKEEPKAESQQLPKNPPPPTPPKPSTSLNQQSKAPDSDKKFNFKYDFKFGSPNR